MISSLDLSESSFKNQTRKKIDSFTCSQSFSYQNEINFAKIRHKLGKNVKNVSLIHVIYTGGTIGMMKDFETGSLRPESNFLVRALRKIDIFNNPQLDPEFEDIPNLFILPQVIQNTRIAFILQEYDKLLDSSNCTFDNWISMARDIEEYYNEYDGFVILHGTDTLAYASSALSFIIEGLSKPVIVTGSQIPISELRTDGRENFLGSLLLAANPIVIPEVCVYFNKNLIRGSRAVKDSSVHFNAFASPNFPVLAELAIDIKIHEDFLFRSDSEIDFKICDKLSNDVAILKIFPSISDKFIEDFFNSSVKGVILQSYGAGNVPSLRLDMIRAFKNASKRGVLIVNITQCYRGGVLPIYETGAQLLECGVIPGFDMTTEAALTKLSYVLGVCTTLKERRKMMCTNLRGEVTIPHGFSDSNYLELSEISA